ncbi:MAG TPA: GT-D fold domain-containing glycosyltransferase [Bacilli bacterium]
MVSPHQKRKFIAVKRTLIPRKQKKHRKITIGKRVPHRVKQQKLKFSKGYNLGYNAGIKHVMENKGPEFQLGFDDGFKKGIYSGGDGIVDQMLPFHAILPEITIQQIIQAGLEHSQHHLYQLMDVAAVIDQLIHAMDTHTPMSVVRLGDGELLTMAQELLLDLDHIRTDGYFLSYAGVDVPDLAARDQLADAVRKATIVGIPKLRIPNFLPLMFPVFLAHGIDYRSLTLIHSTVNYILYTEGYLPRLLSGRRVLLVGNTAPGLANILRENGVHVVEAISPVQGVKDIPRIMASIRTFDFDIALVSAGIAAVIIAQKVASELGKVAIDFGHLADSIVKGEAPYTIEAKL